MTTGLGVLALAAVYLLVLGRAGTADVLAALVVAGAVRAALHAFLRETGGPRVPGTPSLARRLLALPWFAAGVLLDVGRGTRDVTAVVLGRPASPGIVEVPVEARTRAGVLAATLAITLSPGSVVVDVDLRRRRMRLHVIDARDAAAVRARIRHFHLRYQRAAFP